MRFPSGVTMFVTLVSGCMQPNPEWDPSPLQNESGSETTTVVEGSTGGGGESSSGAHVPTGSSTGGDDPSEGGELVEGLMMHWRLDDSEGVTATEPIAGKDGTLLNNPAWQPTAGRIGGALELDGVSQGIAVPEVVIAPDLDRTLALWFKAHQWETSRGGTGLFQGAATGDADGYIHMFSADIQNGTVEQIGSGVEGVEGVEMIETDDGDQYGSRAIAGMELETWHHLAIVFRGDGQGDAAAGEFAGVYLDGQLASTYSNTIPGVLTLDRIGKGYGLEPYHNGLIDDVRVYDRALTAEEVWTLHASAE